MAMDRLTTTIKRQWLAEIISGRKKIEYREAKPYWKDRLAKLTTPFELRLINGMDKLAPEVTVLVDRVRLNGAKRQYELRILRVLRYSNWDKRRQVALRTPKRRRR
jgi:hypothetical protein